MIVLDHVGGPIGIGPYAGRQDDVFRHWRQSIRKLAVCPNIHVKLGSLGMRMGGFDFHERDLPLLSSELAAAWKPYRRECIEAFGPSHCMFESNFPVGKGTASCRAIWNAFKFLADDLSGAEKTAGIVLRNRQSRLFAEFDRLIGSGGSSGGVFRA